MFRSWRMFVGLYSLGACPCPLQPQQQRRASRQTVMVENLPEGRPPSQLESCDLVFLIKLKLLGYRPTCERGVLESRGFSMSASTTGLSKQDFLVSASQKLDLFRAPLDLAKGGSW